MFGVDHKCPVVLVIVIELSGGIDQEVGKPFAEEVLEKANGFGIGLAGRDSMSAGSSAPCCIVSQGSAAEGNVADRTAAYCKSADCKATERYEAYGAAADCDTAKRKTAHCQQSPGRAAYSDDTGRPVADSDYAVSNCRFFRERIDPVVNVEKRYAEHLEFRPALPVVGHTPFAKFLDLRFELIHFFFEFALPAVKHIAVPY